MRKILSLLGLTFVLFACLGPSTFPGTPTVLEVTGRDTRLWETITPTIAVAMTTQKVSSPTSATVTPTPIKTSIPAFAPAPTTLNGLPTSTISTTFVLTIPLPLGRVLYDCQTNANNRDWDVYLLDLNRMGGNCQLSKELSRGDKKWGIYRLMEIPQEFNLTRYPAIDSIGRWLPESSTISFASDRLGLRIEDPEAGELSREVHWYLMDLETGEVTPLRALYPRGGLPTWSPDGQYVAYVQGLAPWQWQQETEIWIADHEGNTKRFLTLGDEPAWSPEGDWIAFLHYPYGLHDRVDSEIYLIRPDGSEKHLLVQNRTPIHGIDWSHDGQKIAFIAGDIYIVDVFEGQIVRVLDVNSGGTSITWSPDDQWLAYDDSMGSIYAVHIEQPWIIVLSQRNEEASCYFPDWGR